MTNLIRRNNRYQPGLGLFNAGTFDLLDEMFGTKYSPGLKTVSNVNVTNNESSWEIALAAPGLTRKDFNVSIKNDVLTIGYHTDDTHTSTFTNGSYARSWTIPETISAEDISASYKNGILLVTIAKPMTVEQTETTITIK